MVFKKGRYYPKPKTVKKIVTDELFDIIEERIKEGKTVKEIKHSDVRLLYMEQIIFQIRAGMVHIEEGIKRGILDGEGFPLYYKNINKADYTEGFVRIICEKLDLGWPPTRIVDAYCVPVHIVRNIKKGLAFKSISNEYDFMNKSTDYTKLSEKKGISKDKLEAIAHLLIAENKSIADIATILKMDTSTVNDIILDRPCPRPVFTAAIDKEKEIRFAMKFGVTNIGRD